jgi:DNA-binding transcriptional LysR family regulator
MAKNSSTKTRGPSLDALRDLLAFHDFGGVSVAARELGEHQPVVTRRLQFFHKKSAPGENLLKRSGKKLELTDTGNSVIPAIRQLIDQYDRLLDYIRLKSTTAQALKIGCGTFSVSQYLPGVVARFRNEFPDVELLIRIERGRDRIRGTAEGRFDLSIITHSPQQVRETLKEAGFSANALSIEDLCSHRLAVIGLRGSEPGQELDAYKADRPLPVKELKKWEPVGLDRDSGIRQQLEAACPAPNDLYFSVEGGGWAAAREYARLQMGVAILPEAMLTPEDRQAFVVRSLGKDFVLVDRLIYRKDLQNPAVNDAIRLLKQAVG